MIAGAHLLARLTVGFVDYVLAETSSRLTDPGENQGWVSIVPWDGHRFVSVEVADRFVAVLANWWFSDTTNEGIRLALEMVPS